MLLSTLLKCLLDTDCLMHSNRQFAPRLPGSLLAPAELLPPAPPGLSVSCFWATCPSVCACVQHRTTTGADHGASSLVELHAIADCPVSVGVSEGFWWKLSLACKLLAVLKPCISTAWPLSYSTLWRHITCNTRELMSEQFTLIMYHLC